MERIKHVVGKEIKDHAFFRCCVCMYHVHQGDLILRVLDCIVTVSSVCILCCGCFNFLCNVWVSVCVRFVMCGCFGNMWTCIYCFVLFVLLCFLYCFVYVYLFLFVLSVPV